MQIIQNENIMTTKIKKHVFIILGAMLILTSCKKDYVEGGKISDINRFANVTTLDALRSMPQFDTLVQLIDAAGIQDQINAKGTLFAPTNGSVRSYLSMRTLFLQNTVDLSKSFLLDSLTYHLKNNLNGIKDSLLMYLIDKPLTPDLLTEDGTVYPTKFSGDNVSISFEETTDGNMGYTDLISSVPRLMFYAQLWGREQSEEDEQNKILIKTAFIKTENGIINVLDPGHTLFFYGR